MSPRKRSRPGMLTRWWRRTPDPAESLVLVLPLLVAYEAAMLALDAPARNGAEMVVSDLFQNTPASAVDAVRWTMVGLLTVFLVIRTLRGHEARSPWPLVLLEGAVLAAVLGPSVGWMVGHVGLSVPHGTIENQPLWLSGLLSVGAGVWEEIVFRFGLLGGLVVLLRRAARLDELPSLGIGILVSAVVFALYHHVGDFGEPLDARTFAFRMVAGTILGFLFATRGFAVVVYMHVFYDLWCDAKLAWI